MRYHLPVIPRRPCFGRVTIPCLLLAVVLATSAHGRSRVRSAACEEALRLRIDFNEALRESRHDDALRLMLRAGELCPDPRDPFALGVLYERMGNAAAAVEHYQRFLDTTVPNPNHTAARVALDRLQPTVLLDSVPDRALVFLDGAKTPLPRPTPIRLPLVVGPHTARFEVDGFDPKERGFVVEPEGKRDFVVRLDPRVRLLSVPTGAEVRVGQGEAPLGVTPLELALPVGTHALRFTLPDHAPTLERIGVGLRGRRTFRVTLEPARTSTAAAPTWRWVMLGGGGALAGAALVVGLAAQDRVETRDAARTRDAWRAADDEAAGLATGTYVLTGLAVSALATGLVMWALDDPPRSTAGTTAAPTAHGTRLPGE